MSMSKITRGFQVTIPKEIREMRGLKEGDNVIFVTEGDKVDIIKFEKDVVMSAAGLWKGMNETGVEYERRLRKGWKERTEKEYDANRH